MKKKIRLMQFLLLMLTVLLCACGDAKDERKTATVSYVPEGSSDSRIENERYELSLEENYSIMTLRDKVTGEVWSSSPTDENFDKESLNPLWQKRTASVLQIGYTNITSGLGVINNSALLQMDYTAAGRLDGDVLYVSYDLSQPAIRLTLAFSLEEDGFRVKVPYEGIEEYGDTFSLVSVTVLPFMGGATDVSEGYYLYPDGSGAIMEFQDIAHIGVSNYSYEIYGNMEKYEEMCMEFEPELPQVMLPVYGVRIGNRGYITVITQGEADSRITISCSTKVIPLNSIYGEFIYRRGFEDARVKTSTVLSYASGLIEGDREVYYRFLEEGAADYSHMAANYREYLQASGIQYGEAKGEFPLMLDVLMGIEEEGLLFDEFKQTTSFEQAEEMMSELTASGVAGLQVNLKGYTKGGYHSEPLKFSINSSIGGKGGLKKFLKAAGEAQVPVTLDMNILNAWSRKGGFSTRKDIIYLGNYTVLTDQEESLFLLSPDVATARMQKFTGKAQKYDIAGYSLSGVADVLAYNYNDGHRYSAEDTIGIWREMLSGLKENVSQVTVTGGNGYVFGYADCLKGIPGEDLGFRYTTRSVPFYQMVVHGMADYTMTAGNLSGDLETAKLKWIEYGCVPYFELTFEGSEELMHTSYNQLFTSRYDSWKGDVVQLYTELKETVGGLRGLTMEEHACLSAGLYRVTYSDGTRVYVNYSYDHQEADGFTIPARGYQVVKGEES